MKELIRGFVKKALEKSVINSVITQEDVNAIPNIEITKTKDPKFGHYSTNIALILAGQSKRKPRDLAESIANSFEKNVNLFEKLDIAGPGFINFFIAPQLWYETLHEVHTKMGLYGAANEKKTEKILLEFVSANPTGPLHVGHGRGAALGDTLAKLLRFAGHNITTEYYVNDTGNQMRILGKSLLVRLRQIKGESINMPENHYVGDYMLDIAEKFNGTPESNRLLLIPEDEALPEASRYACNKILQGIKEDLESFGVHYDNYFSEEYLHQTGAVLETLSELRERNRAQYQDGALWFLMDGEEDEKDRVLVRATGEPTYFAADAAYHRNKIARGFSTLIDIWGSDHHGYVPRVKASLEALGNSPDMLKVLLVQFVNLIREGEKISMSTRSGKFITLKEVLDEVGSDAARFFFLTKRSDSHLDFDLDLAKKHSKDNPVYYVQYAHARISSIFRIGLERSIDTSIEDPDLTLLSSKEEIALIKHLADFPDMISEAAESLEPHRVTFYLIELADLFHSYYHDNKVLTEDPDIKKARLYLVQAVQQVLKNGLDILGVSAPERM